MQGVWEDFKWILKLLLELEELFNTPGFSFLHRHENAVGFSVGMVRQEFNGLLQNFNVLFETGENEDMCGEIVSFFGIKSAFLLHDFAEPKVVDDAADSHGDDDEEVEGENESWEDKVHGVVVWNSGNGDHHSDKPHIEDERLVFEVFLIWNSHVVVFFCYFESNS